MPKKVRAVATIAALLLLLSGHAYAGGKPSPATTDWVIEVPPYTKSWDSKADLVIITSNVDELTVKVYTGTPTAGPVAGIKAVKLVSTTVLKAGGETLIRPRPGYFTVELPLPSIRIPVRPSASHDPYLEEDSESPPPNCGTPLFDIYPFPAFAAPAK